MTKDEQVPAYTPNHIPVSTRVFYLLFSAGLVAYGAFGLWIDDLFIPGKRSRGVHLHGNAAWAMAGAMAFAALNMLSVVVDHFDQRNNETNYRLFGKVTYWLGFGFLGLAFVLHANEEFAFLPF